MADELFNINMSKVTNVASGFVDWVLIILLAIVLILIIWGIFYLLSFKNLVRVRQATASGYVIIDTKAREFTTKDGVKKWRLLKWIKSSIIAPPVENMELTKKGKFSVECDRNSDGAITWRKIRGNADGGDAFTGEERTMTAGEMRRANEYNKKGLADKIFEIAPMIIMVIILVMIFAFWGDFVKTTSEAAVEVKSATIKLSEAMDSQNEILSKCEGNINWSQYQKINVDNKGINLPPIPN